MTPVARTVDKAPQLAGLSLPLVARHPPAVPRAVGKERQSLHSVVQRPRVAIGAAADERERQVSPQVAQLLPFVAGSAVNDTKEYQTQVPSPHPPLAVDLLRTHSLEQWDAEHMASNTCSGQMADGTVSFRASARVSAKQQAGD